MKLTKETLKQIIKEELEAVMKEDQLPTMSKGMPDQREEFKNLEPGQFTIKQGNGKNIGDILYVKMEDGSEKYAGNLNQRVRGGQKYDNAGNPVTVFDQNKQRADAAKTALVGMGYKEV
jgi:hypothetical protein